MLLPGLKENLRMLNLLFCTQPDTLECKYSFLNFHPLKMYRKQDVSRAAAMGVMLFSELATLNNSVINNF